MLISRSEKVEYRIFLGRILFSNIKGDEDAIMGLTIKQIKE